MAAIGGDAAGQALALKRREELSEQMTEEEAALYDRQLRLWGSVAQSRIRQCRAIIAPFQGGVAVEAAKNLILAGVRELILVDDGLVEGGSLTASFAWREADVGQSRIEAALPRLSSLNPHVTITTVFRPPSVQTLTEVLTDARTGSPVSALLYTNSNPYSSSGPSTLSSLADLNDICRKHEVKFLMGQAQGLDGVLFQDFGIGHQFLVERKRTSRDDKNATVETTWTELQRQDFVTLREALSLGTQKQPWKNKSIAATKRALKGSEGLWATIALWNLAEFREANNMSDLPSVSGLLVDEMQELARKHGGPQEASAFWKALDLGNTPEEWARTFLVSTIPLGSGTQPADFAPTTAVLGGILAQETLNAVGGREAPKVANWMNWYGLKGQAPVLALGDLGSISSADVAASTEAVAAALSDRPQQKQ